MQFSGPRGVPVRDVMKRDGDLFQMLAKDLPPLENTFRFFGYA
jgi:hypothetical protein